MSELAQCMAKVNSSILTFPKRLNKAFLEGMTDNIFIKLYKQC